MMMAMMIDMMMIVMMTMMIDGETNNLLQHLWPRALSARAPGLEPKWVRIINGRNGFNEYSWHIPMQVYLIYYKNHNAPTPTQ